MPNNKSIDRTRSADTVLLVLTKYLCASVSFREFWRESRRTNGGTPHNMDRCQMAKSVHFAFNVLHHSVYVSVFTVV